MSYCVSATSGQQPGCKCPKPVNVPNVCASPGSHISNVRAGTQALALADVLQIHRLVYLTIGMPTDPSSPSSFFPPVPGLSKVHCWLCSPSLWSPSPRCCRCSRRAGCSHAPICMSLTRLSPLRAVFCFLLPRTVSIWDSISNPWLPGAFLSSHLSSALSYSSLLHLHFILVCEHVLWGREAPRSLHCRNDVTTWSSLCRSDLEKEAPHHLKAERTVLWWIFNYYPWFHGWKYSPAFFLPVRQHSGSRVWEKRSRSVTQLPQVSADLLSSSGPPSSTGWGQDWEQLGVSGCREARWWEAVGTDRLHNRVKRFQPEFHFPEAVLGK